MQVMKDFEIPVSNLSIVKPLYITNMQQQIHLNYHLGKTKNVMQPKTQNKLQNTRGANTLI